MAYRTILLIVLSLFFISIINFASSDDKLLSKKEFIQKAFGEKTATKQKLRFKGDVKTTAQKIMGSKYRKAVMRYWIEGQRTA